ncbi:hypothetical protein ABZT17_26745 [Streptomyces sp. NPDC005648]|uniref:hypothetical protein n=1 Tax=Streptomyces sp. NPDC005648 TaxID=3157044 RepID=UPI0033B223E5
MGAPATPPPPEAMLIRLVREAAGLSPEVAAARMEIKFSGSRWRQIERGWRKDSDTQVIAPSTTLAHICWTLGISADRLAETGRDDAVEILRELERSKGSAAEEQPAPAPFAELEEWQQRVILNALDERPRSAAEKALLLRRLATKIESHEKAAAHAAPPGGARGPYPVTGRTDLSDLVRTARDAAGLSLEDVAARAVDPGTGDHVIEVDWLERLESATLTQEEFPAYPQLDALVSVLGLDLAQVRAAAGGQFLGLETIWSTDGRVMANLKGEHLTPEAAQKAQALMDMFRTAPERRGQK